MATITVVQLQDDAPPGLLVPWATARTLDLEVLRADRGDEFPAPALIDAVIILGSDRSVNDAAVPWLAGLRDWTAAVLGADVPVLGICFGAQLMATALGAPVAAMAMPEIGWIDIDTVDPGLSAGPWLSWHEDGIGAGEAIDVVAGNARGIQAFRSRAAPHKLGVQFHPEVTATIVRDWARIDGGRSLAAAGVSDRALERETRRHAAGAVGAAEALFDGWARAASVLS